jgi:hypothetical protein
MQNLVDPAILFFVLGALAGVLKSNLEIPPQISRFLSLYLLMALGLKGGFALNHSGFTPQVVGSLASAVLLAIAIPAAGYFLLRRLVSGFDAAAIAATYGSVSAVTFITATQYLETHNLAYGGHMAAAMALMESPAIVMAVLFANALRKQYPPVSTTTAPALENQVSSPAQTNAFGSVFKILHESLTDGAQILLLGSMVVGFVTGDAGKAAMKPFSGDLFKGMLAFFLLDMGLMAAKNALQTKGTSPWVIAYAVFGPVFHASAALAVSVLAGLPQGDGALLMILSASASYIAVPAALRFAIPEARPALYFGMSLGVTFPLNILVGIPVYVHAARLALG